MKAAKYIYIYIIGVLLVVALTGCTGKNSQNLTDIPDDQEINHSDSLVFAARKTGDFNRVLAVIDSLVFHPDGECGEDRQCVALMGLRTHYWAQCGQEG